MSNYAPSLSMPSKSAPPGLALDRLGMGHDEWRDEITWDRINDVE